jgi:fructokinase
MVPRPLTVVGIGELLWDVFPDGKHLGGAPANFAYISSLLGNRAVVISRLGNDPLGREALELLQGLRLSADHIQNDSVHPTGTVTVRLGADGVPEFTIHENVAWDHIGWTPAAANLASQADIVCFGSLAQRNRVRVFDVNLRQHFFSPEILAASIRTATVVKLNHEELPRVLSALGLPAASSDLEGARAVIAKHGPTLVCITRGDRGSLLVTDTDHAEHAGFKVQVADTVGSGDAFTAALAHGFCNGHPLSQISDTANRLGAWVATQSGATPSTNSRPLAEILGLIG